MAGVFPLHYLFLQISMQQQHIRNNPVFFIIAGEASGDNLGAKLIQQVKQQKPKAEFFGVGGQKMLSSGLPTSIFKMEDISVMGFLEIIPHIPRILNRMRLLQKAIAEIKPDFIITIDSPDFCFRVIKKLRQSNYYKMAQKYEPHGNRNNQKNQNAQDYGAYKSQHPMSQHPEPQHPVSPHSVPKLIHIVAPSVWVYRRKRAKLVAQLYDDLFTILPFEAQYFTPFEKTYGLKTHFVGHPLFEDMPNIGNNTGTSDVAGKGDATDTTKEGVDVSNEAVNQAKHVKPVKPIGQGSVELSQQGCFEIAFFAGSRITELKRFLPIYKKVIKALAERYPDFTAHFYSTPNLRQVVQNFTEQHLTGPNICKNVKITSESSQKYTNLVKARLAIAKSGTNSLEISYMGLPVIICYKMNYLTAFIGRLITSLKFANLLNIIEDRCIIPEFLQENFTAENILQAAITLLENESLAAKQIADARLALQKLGAFSKTSPSKKIADIILASHNDYSSHNGDNNRINHHKGD
jgi:lipid-A-disaccharide synthase